MAPYCLATCSDKANLSIIIWNISCESSNASTADEGEQRLGDVLDYGGACVLDGFSLLPFLFIIAASLLSSAD